MNTLLKLTAIAGCMSLSSLATAQASFGDSSVNTVQARFEAFSACNARARAAESGTVSCDDEAQALRAMIGGGNKSSSKSSSQPRTIPASMEKTVTQ